MQTAYIALGSNLGDRLVRLRQAAADLRMLDGHLRCSPVYEGAAHTLHPGDKSPDFLNAVVEVRTNLGAEDLLDFCQKIEHRAGRKRSLPYAPRTLDVDILVLGYITRNTDRITLPHPRLQERRFVLQPWYDLSPECYIPDPVDSTVSVIRAQCTDCASLSRTPWKLFSTDQGHLLRMSTAK